ncbi:MAG: hypothetical protein PHY87_02595 [Sphaerochaeta sp.]|jgi:hypothetical protein|uniref:hypothetical protein n=1 Tax=Sphaerochaeta sp. TaxID=1972642 RepID=UPI001D417195|nr:hypothetical protein [uncultured Sphaerochaeta sp.]MDD3058406.1 hypothetical protein [Sphaerochaeta sp.]MDD3928663.1 hypothetical protein [Sphaerochaeta sp.]NCC12750.1 hypothetical protein [Spirochaetia bacterium]NCC89539.1 hypothetical protein [Spirochaetia bacterium]
MLQTRRLLAFSSRVHTYTLLLYLFFFLVYILGSFFPVDASFVALLQFSLHLISWTSLLFGFWILVFSVVVWVSDRVFPFSTAILTVGRMLVVFLLSLVVAILEQVIQQGVVVSL